MSGEWKQSKVLGDAFAGDPDLTYHPPDTTPDSPTFDPHECKTIDPMYQGIRRNFDDMRYH